MMNQKKLMKAAVIAAIYVVLSVVFQPISYGVIQFRIAEALTVLPILYAESVWGLFVGCLLANMIGGAGVMDVVFGSLATLAAAWLTRRFKDSKAAYVFPVIINAVVVGAYLAYLFAMPYWSVFGSVFIGEAVVIGTLGVILIKAAQRIQ
ncbi:QueT transporter family protein [Propionispora vibrioides]|jgi:uncharacterized membrane protein|uniref:Uncharacterized membrane protein n=1 Tax=Propionispora vibrioides TaxID=112903 RepID=A0A1H8V2S0_9FIRM|nr:QueT transporter family protein [Propionispora vibrioides]SEP09686.1 Uncharacterized membrane protein [Propionispora vibrioides]